MDRRNFLFWCGSAAAIPGLMTTKALADPMRLPLEMQRPGGGDPGGGASPGSGMPGGGGERGGGGGGGGRGDSGGGQGGRGDMGGGTRADP